ncbi:ABC-F family ATP-binding cassette domain-containing protein [Aporhodopirellula aestuarii]|uniref:ATP-binding cassette domain-containing protein n=1 Tax=Aporhodopirellula aestuarii TaxID=2950107 RepID=A0ABT0TZA9_9BACT|nr:ABC-F family ATP-binding cassette domain-containing protein [Aporhodopirellula aestuarii]MCM2369948.1 ATP-binding cassette domain-containing protein [Aporhodopirellula aestuarii]
MAKSISVTGVTFRLPNRAPLFTDLHVSFGALRTGIVGRNGVGKTTLFKLIRGELQPNSGSISVVGTTAVLDQLVHVDEQRTIADVFSVSAELAILKRIAEGIGTESDFSNADWTLETRIATALGRLGLDFPADRRIALMSGGQRTRVGIASLLFSEVDFLLLDEPTNHLDRDGRETVLEFLESWKSGALVISHDREVLELMDSIVELTSLGAKSYGGNWDEYQTLKSQELSAAQRDLAEAEKRSAQLAKVGQEKVERQSRRNRAGKKSAAKGGMPRILIGARKERSELTTADKGREAARFREQASQLLNDARKKIEVIDPFRVELSSTNLHPSKTILQIDDVTFGFDPERPLICNFTMTVTGPERIVISGPNGSGKTTLIDLIAGNLQPWSGSIDRRTEFAILDQTVRFLGPDGTVRENYLRINPTSTENECRAALARFKFRSDAALQDVSTLSGGELLRAGLACVLGGPAPPRLLILDEPTNHLDLESIDTIEAGLKAYDGALVVISHDAAFLKSISITREINLGATAS